MIGGNLKAMIQVSTETANIIGESVLSWEDIQLLTGWLDLSSGEARYNTYNAKIQESTHIFIADYVPLDSRITAENSRMIVNGKMYDILLIDNPSVLQIDFVMLVQFHRIINQKDVIHLAIDKHSGIFRSDTAVKRHIICHKNVC